MSQRSADPSGQLGIDMAQFVALRAASCIGAEYSNFALLDRTDHRTIRLFHSSFLDESIAHRYVEFDIDSVFPIAAAIRTRQTINLSGPDDHAEEFAELWAMAAAPWSLATLSDTVSPRPPTWR